MYDIKYPGPLLLLEAYSTQKIYSISFFFYIKYIHLNFLGHTSTAIKFDDADAKLGNMKFKDFLMILFNFGKDCQGVLSGILNSIDNEYHPQPLIFKLGKD